MSVGYQPQEASGTCSQPIHYDTHIHQRFPQVGLKIASKAGKVFKHRLLGAQNKLCKNLFQNDRQILGHHKEPSL